VRLWWIWRAFVYLPALAIGFFAKGKPMLLSGAAYLVCAVFLSFNGHGPYGFEDSLASSVIFGDVVGGSQLFLNAVNSPNLTARYSHEEADDLFASATRCLELLADLGWTQRAASQTTF
jgi:hypothetical protein